MYKYRFTIFTPTYNRANILQRVYQSLLNQSYKDFEWLIIDDGSTDDTKSIIDEFINENKINIRYYYQENAHKFFSLLKAFKLADGFFFVPLDSDDECLPQTLDFFSSEYDSIEENTKSTIAGINCLCMDQFGKTIGDNFPQDKMISDNEEMVITKGIRGEKWGCIKTDILKNYSFPNEYFNNGYIPEGLIWYRIANDGYKTLYRNVALRIYYINENKSSIMEESSVNFIKNSFGAVEEAKYALNKHMDLFWNNPLYFIKKAIIYSNFCTLRNISFLKQYKMLQFKGKLLFLMTLPISILLNSKFK
jgi:glycosyltransferase involved in cell wall biosynthesis